MDIPKQPAQHRSVRLVRGVGNVLLVISLILCDWLICGAIAAGWMMHANHYGATFSAYGITVFVCAAGMSLSVLFYFLRRDLLAMVLGLLSHLPTLLVMLRAISIAEKNSWGGQTEASFGRNAADVWQNGLMVAQLPLIILAVLTLSRYFSSASKHARKEKKKREESLPAPSILGGMTHASDSEKTMNRRDE